MTPQSDIGTRLQSALALLREHYGLEAGERAAQFVGEVPTEPPPDDPVLWHDPPEADIYVIGHPKLKQAFAGLYEECRKLLTSDNPEIPLVRDPDWGKISIFRAKDWEDKARAQYDRAASFQKIAAAAEESRKRALKQYAEVLRRAEEADKRAEDAEALVKVAEMRECQALRKLYDRSWRGRLKRVFGVWE
jgi:hypothetical protein